MKNIYKNPCLLISNPSEELIWKKKTHDEFNFVALLVSTVFVNFPDSVKYPDYKMSEIRCSFKWHKSSKD